MNTQRGILKGCNCCKSSNRFVRTLNPGARIARCPRCRTRTVFDALSPEEAAEYRAKVERGIAFIESLFEEQDQ